MNTAVEFQVMPPLTVDEYNDLHDSIKEHGVQVPITVDENSIVIDGHHRRKIASEIGIDCPTVVKAGLTDTEKRTLALSLNIDRRHLNREQKRALVERSLRSDPQLTDREHARRTGASPSTVGSARSRLEKVSKLDTFAERVDPRTGNATQPATRRRDHTEEDFDRMREECEKEESELPATLAHKTPYKPGYVLTLDSRGTKPLITVGEDGRATSTRESYIKAMDWWRENPRAQQYTAVKETGLPTSAMSETSSALRKNGEIPKVSNSGRAQIEEFGLLATAVKNLGLSVEKMLSEGTFEFIDSEGMDYYMDGLRDGMKSLRKFQQLAQQISNN